MMIFFLSVFTSVGCKPKSVGLKADYDIFKLRGNSSSASTSNGPALTDTVVFRNQSLSLMTPLLASACVWNIPVLFEELDVLSLRFTPISGPNISISNTHPTLLTYPLHAHSSGGTLNLQLALNSVSNAESLHLRGVSELSFHAVLL